MSNTFSRMLQRADKTQTGAYHFDDGEKVVNFPDKADEILDKRRQIESAMVEARGEVDLAISHYNSLTDDYNEFGREAARILRDKYGMMAHPTLRAKLDLSGPESHGTVPPALPEDES